MGKLQKRVVATVVKLWRQCRDTDNDNIYINNIIPKMQMMKILIEQVIKARDDDFTSEKEHNTIKIQI
jgi:hypothetical protein